MRNPRYDRYGQMPHTVSASTRQSHTPTNGDRKMPDVVIENTDRGRNDYRSDRHQHHHQYHMHGNHGGHGSQGNHVASASNHIQPVLLSMDDTIGMTSTGASNPNRSDVPSKQRKGSLDPVNY